MSLSGKICLVTGASRGIGRGIAAQLGQAGATVYVTGQSGQHLEQCAEIVNSRGGKCIPMAIDHSKDAQVTKLFETIKSENHGQLDVLVYNAYAAVDLISWQTGQKFYKADPIEQWDCINGVGLRNHFLCSVYASRMMVERKDGLIVNISSAGGLKYLFNVAYGIGKAGCDRMAADCAHELRKNNVTMVSLWPGPVKTEYIQENILTPGKQHDNNLLRQTIQSFELGGFMARPTSVNIFENSESVEFAGKAIVKLAEDHKRIRKTGKILLVSDLARHYGFTDEDGDIHDMRSIKNFLKSRGQHRLASLIPGYLRFPLLLMHLTSNKF